jgi:hypothetical protein
MDAHKLGFQPRLLKPEERSLIGFLLSADFQGRDSLEKQIDRIEVVGECDCGCGTIYLRVKEAGSSGVGYDQVVVEAYGNGVDVLLFARDELLSCLEIVDHGDSPPLPYPSPADLRLWIPPTSRTPQGSSHKHSRRT